MNTQYFQHYPLEFKEYDNLLSRKTFDQEIHLLIFPMLLIQ